jgi:ABC-type branched-subunit amino acid transport system ATPase component
VLLLDEPAAGVPRHERAEPKYEWLRQEDIPLLLTNGKVRILSNTS